MSYLKYAERIDNWKMPSEENKDNPIYQYGKKISQTLYEEDEYYYPSLKTESDEEKGSSLAEKLAYRILSKYNKHATVLVEGETGSGKSHLVLRLAQGCAEILAKETGKNPEDFFNIETNISVIDPTMLNDQMQNMKRYNIYIFDDAGAGLAAREFMAKQNRYLTKVIQTCRTNNNIIIFTVPSGDYIDVIFRKICRYKIEVTNAVHQRGLTMMKIYQQRYSSRLKKTFYVNITTRGKIVKSWYSRAIEDKNLVAKYEKIRAENALKVADDNPAHREEKLSERYNYVQESINSHGEYVVELIRENPMISRSTLGSEIGESAYFAEKIANNLGYIWKGRKIGWCESD